MAYIYVEQQSLALNIHIHFCLISSLDLVFKFITIRNILQIPYNLIIVIFHSAMSLEVTVKYIFYILVIRKFMTGTTTIML